MSGTKLEPSSTASLHTGRRMPVLGLGTWQLLDHTAATIEQALRLGYRMIDTSGDYGTEPGVGDGIRASGLPRDEVFVATKVEEEDDAYAATRRGLGKLGLDYADLMLIHRPPPEGVGTHLWEGLRRAREEGLTREIGVSNYSIEQLGRLIDETGEVPVVNQIEWSPFGWSPEMLEFCRERGIVVQAYSPLTRGERLGDARLREIADRVGATPAQVLLRWNLQLGVVPLPKANRLEHLVENLGAFEFELSDEDMRRLGELNEHYSALGATLQYV